jgi:hypothetical protein
VGLASRSALRGEPSGESAVTDGRHRRKAEAMSRWRLASGLEHRREQAGFDPVVEGARLGISRELALEIWNRVCPSDTDSFGRPDLEQVRRRFCEIAERIAARGGRLYPDVGRVTRVAIAADGAVSGARTIDPSAARVPGRETRVMAEARRWAAMGGEPAAVPAEAAARPQASDPPLRDDGSIDGDLAAPWQDLLDAGADRDTGGGAAYSDRLRVEPAGTTHGGGSPLPAELEERFSAGFGHDFRAVRVHVGATRPGIAAMTQGTTIQFTPGRWDPESGRGQALIAHELAHVVQQSRGGGATGKRSELEAEAGRAAARIMSGEMAGVELAAPRGARQYEEDWNFTPEDYADLRSRGGVLRFGPDSAWLPPAIRQNLLATLNALLGQRRRGRVPTGTVPFSGVSSSDLYHGHVVVPRGRLTPEMRAAQTSWGDAGRRAQQISGTRPLTDANRDQYRDAVHEQERRGTPLLERVAQLGPHGDLAHTVPGSGILYHTLEVRAGQAGPHAMPTGDPRRNILTRFDDLAPRTFTPSAPDSAEFRDQFDEVLTFSFLIDEHGVIHAHADGLRGMSLATGRDDEGTADRLLDGFAPQPEASPPQPPLPPPSPSGQPVFGTGRGRPSQTVYVDSATAPTSWSFTMDGSHQAPMPSFHEIGRPNYIMIHDQQYELRDDRHVAPALRPGPEDTTPSTRR